MLKEPLVHAINVGGMHDKRVLIGDNQPSHLKGTENVIKAALESGSTNPCTSIVFTRYDTDVTMLVSSLTNLCSSNNVVFDGVTPLLGVDESYPYPPISRSSNCWGFSLTD